MKVTSSFGNQQKFLENEHWYKADNLGYEGLSESITSLFYSTWRNRTWYVPYSEFCFKDGQRGCISPNFLEDGFSIVTLHRLFQALDIQVNKYFKEMSSQQQIEATLNILYNNFGVDASMYFTHQFMLDAFTLNEDRHLNNLIFISEDATGDIYTGPLFDHGMSLLTRVGAYPMGDSITRLAKKVKGEPFSTDLNKQAKIMQALTNYVPEINKNLEIELKEYRSLYSDEEVRRAIQSLMFGIRSAEFVWRWFD